MDPLYPWVGPNGEVPEPPRFKRGTLIVIAIVFAIYVSVIFGGVLALGVVKTLVLMAVLVAAFTLLLVAPLLWSTWYRFGSKEDNYPKEEQEPPDS